MNKEELLRNIKDEVARENGRPNWTELLYWDSSSSGFGNSDLIDQVANRYAIACCEEQKKHDYKVASKRTTEYCGLCVKPLKGDYNNILNTKNVAE